MAGIQPRVARSAPFSSSGARNVLYDSDAQHRNWRCRRRAVDGMASRDCGGNQCLLHAVQLVQLALKRGHARRTLGHRQGALAMRSTSPMTRASIRSGNSAASSASGSQVCSEMCPDPNDDWAPGQMIERRSATPTPRTFGPSPRT